MKLLKNIKDGKEEKMLMGENVFVLNKGIDAEPYELLQEYKKWALRGKANKVLITIAADDSVSLRLWIQCAFLSKKGYSNILYGTTIQERWGVGYEGHKDI